MTQVADAPSPRPILETVGLTKRYGNVTVLDKVSLGLYGGEIHALLGANGAGKSTLCRIASGLIPASQGAMSLQGDPFQPQSKQEAEAAGIEIVQQELNLIPTLSVAENLFLSQLPSAGGIIRTKELHAKARKVLDAYGLREIDTHATIATLGVGRQQMVEIAGALARQCKLLILDEPTAALSDAESVQLFDHLRELRRQGVGIVYISHRLDEVKSLSDRVTVLRDGKLVTTRDTASLATDEMVDLMSGEVDSASRHPHVSFHQHDVALSVDGLSNDPVHAVSFKLHRGERLGVTGLVGSGRTELLRAVFGADTASDGSITIPDRFQGRFTSPSEAVSAGVAMVTEDRKQNGLLLSQSIVDNMTLCSLQNRFSIGGVIDHRPERQTTCAMSESLEVKCTGIDQSVSSLSGGNQQKVAIAKWLIRDAEIFLFDEPTRGIDVAARRRIYRLFESLVSDGKSLLIASSDLDELFETCDRIAVLSAGRLAAIYTRDEWSHEKIMQASFSEYVQ